MTADARITRCAIYARHSVGKADNIANQFKILTAFADGQAWTIVRKLEDGISAYHGAARKDYDELLRMVEAGAVDVVLTVDQDRLSRGGMGELEHVIELCQRHGVRWATPGSDIDLDDPDSVTMAYVRGAFARGEILKMKNRQRRTFDAIAGRGERVAGGQRGFGYEADHHTVNEREAEAIREGAEMIIHGSTITDVMRDWNRRGVTGPQSGEPFNHPSTVRAILQRPRNAGLLVRHGQVVGEGSWPAIISRETFEAVAAKLARNPVPSRGVRSLLGGRHGAGRCVCGNTLGHSVDGQGRGQYRCDPKYRGDRPGPHVWTAPAAEIDAYATEVVITRLSRPDVAGLLPETPGVDVGALSAEAAQLRRRRLELAEAFADGEIDRAQLQAGTTRIDGKLAAIDAELAAAVTVSPLSPFADYERAAEVWEELDDTRRRQVVAALCTVVLSPHGRGRKWTTDTIEVVPV